MILKQLLHTYQAEEMAEIILRRSNRLSLDINCGGLTLMILAYWRYCKYHTRINRFFKKAFRVLNITFNEDYTIQFKLIEHQDSHYTFATKGQVSSTPTTNLPNPFTIQPPASITLSDEMIEYADGVVLTRLNILLLQVP